MRAFCTICSDLFDDANPTLAAPCGHIFHSSCLMKWLDHSRTCPECRNQVTNRNVLKLYFSISNNEHVNYDSLENEIQSLNAKLLTKDKDIETCRREKEEIRYYVSKAEKEVDDLRQVNYKLDSEITGLNLRLKSLSKLEPKVQKLEQRNLALSRDLEHLNHVQVIVSGTQSDVDDILSGCGSGPEAVKQMATYCSMLKRELQQVIDSKQKLRSEITVLKRDIGLNVYELNRFREENNILKEQLANLEKENVALLKRPMAPVSVNKTPKSVISYESPAPERQKVQISLDSDFEVTPIMKSSAPNKRSKIDIVVYDKGYTSIKSQSSVAASSSGMSRIPFSTGSQTESNSIIRTGYNGFGGHSNFISRSSIVQKNIKKKVSKLKPF